MPGPLSHTIGYQSFVTIFAAGLFSGGFRIGFFEVFVLDSLPVCAEIDLKAVAHNVREIRRITEPGAKVMAVVKANGYGHGSIEVSRVALQNGADYLGVARVEEALVLRRAGIDAPILIFGYSPVDAVDQLIRFDLTQTVYSYEMAKALSGALAGREHRLRVHLKVDTGMGRLGLLADAYRQQTAPEEACRQLVQDVASIFRLPGLEIEGIYTHFATADEADKSYAHRQFDLFMDSIESLRREGMEFSLKHAANSAGVLDMPETHLDMVRPGISVYGIYPSGEVNRAGAALKPAMTLKARVINLKKVSAGFKISYGSTWQTRGPATIATVNIGYADGLNRLLSSCGHMLIRGCRAPVVGRVCMDMTMLDVGHIPDVAPGDEVVVFGSQGDGVLSVDEIASQIRTISYEVVTMISGRVQRVYLR